MQTLPIELSRNIGSTFLLILIGSYSGYMPTTPTPVKYQQQCTKETNKMQSGGIRNIKFLYF